MRSNRLQLNTTKTEIINKWWWWWWWSCPQPSAIFSSCRRYHYGLAPIRSRQPQPLPPRDIYTLTVLWSWCLHDRRLTSPRLCRSFLRFCVIYGASVTRQSSVQIRPPVIGLWCRLSSSLDYGNATLAGIPSHFLSRLQSSGVAGRGVQGSGPPPPLSC